jgi:hypothetical protein
MMTAAKLATARRAGRNQACLYFGLRKQDVMRLYPLGLRQPARRES